MSDIDQELTEAIAYMRANGQGGTAGLLARAADAIRELRVLACDRNRTWLEANKKLNATEYHAEVVARSLSEALCDLDSCRAELSAAKAVLTRISSYQPAPTEESVCDRCVDLIAEAMDYLHPDENHDPR